MKETLLLSVSKLTSSQEYDELIRIWEASVRSTHHFLAEEDIQYYKPLIRNEYFQTVELYVIRVPHTPEIAAFMGLSDDQVEMLFVSPTHQGKGYGKILIEYAIREKGLRKVDVNEQNKQALCFYLGRGFEIISWDATDSKGKTFPILHMQLKPIRLRKACSKDLGKLSEVFEQSVRGSCFKDYTPVQIDAWIKQASPERWQELFDSDLLFMVAEETDSFQIAGFISFNCRGYIHSMFLLPSFQGKGIAAALLDFAEDLARRNHLDSLFAEVSLTARRFFSKSGFTTEKQQIVKVNGVEMVNFTMRKILTHPVPYFSRHV